MAINCRQSVKKYTNGTLFFLLTEKNIFRVEFPIKKMTFYLGLNKKSKSYSLYFFYFLAKCNLVTPKGSDPLYG